MLLNNGAIQALRNATVVGFIPISADYRYKVARFSVISVTRGWRCHISRKKELRNPLMAPKGEWYYLFQLTMSTQCALLSSIMSLRLYCIKHIADCASCMFYQNNLNMFNHNQ